MYLLDTSILVSAFTPDDHTNRVLSWLADNEGRPLLVNDWTWVEVASALMLKRRMSHLTQQQYDHVLRNVRRQALSFDLLDVNREHFLLARQLSENATLGIRAGDAIHVAVALANDVTLVTTDKTLLAANTSYGLRVIAP
jgi:uncharacterized protein